MEESTFAPEWIKFEHQLGYRPQLHSPLSRALEDWSKLGSDLVSKLTFPAPDASITTIEKTCNSYGLKVRVYFPPKDVKAGNVSIAIYVHGGGWAMGDLEGEDFQCRLIARDSKMIVVAIDYRLAPTHPFPAGLDDCIDAVLWTYSNAHDLGATKHEVVLIGASAGANLAIATALWLIDNNRSSVVCGLVALVPVTVHPTCVPKEMLPEYRSFSEKAECPIDTADAMAGPGGFWDTYTSDFSHQHVSVLLHPRLHELPRTYIAVAGQDSLRDDGVLFMKALERSSVSVLFHEYSGLPHYFWTIPADALAEVSKSFQANLIKGLKFVLA